MIRPRRGRGEPGNAPLWEQEVAGSNLTARDTRVASVDPNEHDRFLLRQRIRPVVNQYEFFLPDGDGALGPPICFVEQKRFKFKEDIRFYADESKTQELLRIKARQRFDPRARYDVTDPAGTKVGEIQKVFGASLLRSTYGLFDAGGQETARVTEMSLVVALFRRARRPRPVHRGFRRLAADPLPLRVPPRRRGPGHPQPPGLQVPRHLHDRHVGRPAADDRPPHDPGHRRRHGRAPGALTRDLDCASGPP